MTLHYLDPDLEDKQGDGDKVRVRLGRGPADHFVRVPKVVLRQLMSDLGGPEFKVLCFLVDRIYSHSANLESHSDTVSYRQMQNGITTHRGKVVTRGTGLSRDSIWRALKNLEARGLLERVHRIHESGGTAISELRLLLPESEESAHE